ncbi:bifunctional non-homologous end joining protein LigD [Micromonospora pattaloongensis]|uniref:Bifunctional non-homologous end joining protein LigD n=1 Tax=Micromonospora pattaloongensis TaxID=405436 RepID=A0A1H3SM27_9ACTN|nr:non-homologous end-joining DNA ligase [Micromonospora pattaloongensis]SDZ38760.1 bifunctional non-homologous end joining protein LigD [Micromonospora pattaloongensis]
MARDRIKVEVEGRELELSNLEKVLYPAEGFTKGEVIDYYSRIAPTLLPHIRDRALTRIRFPNGVDGQSFFEKNAPQNTPDWVRRERLPAPGSTKEREAVDYVVADDLPTLVWLANLAALELHTPQWRIGADPDLLVVDLDPGAPAGLAECCAVAVLMRDRLADDGITTYPKTSGKKGLQLAAAVSGRQSSEVISGYVRRVAEELERGAPKSITSKMAKKLRPGKIFIDWSQNNAAKTTVAPYSLRAQPVPSASTPLTWDEVEAVVAGRRKARQFTAAEVLARIDEYGDLMAPLLDGGPEVPA